MSKKQTQPVYSNSLMNTPMINFAVYHMKKTEAIAYFLAAFVVGGIVGMVFYANLFMVDGEMTLATYISNTVIFCGVGIFAGKKFLEMRSVQLRDKRKNTLLMQFREMLASLSTALGAGENLRSSFESAYTEMASQFGENSYIAKELGEIVLGMQNNIGIENLMNNFAVRSDLEDVESLANVINICYQKGGNLKSVVSNTYDLIGEKIVINEEIKTKMTSNQMQQNFMSVVPIILIGFMRVSSSAFAESFASATGVVIMTVAVGIFIGAYVYGKKVTDIKG